MTFFLKSQKNLIRVHPQLIQLVNATVPYSPLDFDITDGVRTLEEEKKLVADGVSTTLNSKHLPQKDGLSHAVDLVPVRDGVITWNWPDIYILAFAVRRAAKEHNISVVWGGCWDKNFTESTEDPRAFSEAYVARRKAAGKRVFLDGPHYQLADV